MFVEVGRTGKILWEKTGLIKSVCRGEQDWPSVPQEGVGLVRTVCGSGGLIKLSLGADRIGKTFHRNQHDW